jgi:Carboxypeptidase regulatory-like domain
MPSNANQVFLAVAMLLTVWTAAPVFGQSASVLGVVPEGVVVEAAGFEGLRPGARIGFRRPDGSGAQVGEGWVLDVREGRALVGLKPGGSVQAGDIAAPCASLSDPGSPGDLRAPVQALKSQLASAGGGSVEVQATVAQLESALDARETAIRDGTCDVSTRDQQIAALSMQLQQLIAAPVPAAPTGTPPPPPPLESPSGVMPGQETGVGTPPPPDAPAAGASSSGLDNLTTALQVVQQLVQMAQSMGLVGGRGSTGGQPGATFSSPDAPPPPPPSQVTFPQDPGSGQISAPPIVSTPPGSPPSVDSGPPPPPPAVGPPSPPVVRDRPPPKFPPKSPTVDAPPDSPSSGESGSRPPGRPPVVSQPPKSGQLWTTTPPKSLSPATDPGSGSSGTSGSATSGGSTPPGDTPSSGGNKPAAPSTTPAPVLRPGPGTATLPGAGGQTARLTPPGRMATVQGTVERADSRAPIAGAIIVVGGRKMATNTLGKFVVNDVPLGRQTLVVTAPGFVQGKLALELTAGEVETVKLMLRPATATPLAPAPR